MLKNLFLFVLIISNWVNVFGQCPNGVLVINSGGCLSGCDLTPLGGPNCAALGNPTGNAVPAISVTQDFMVPSGCTITVSATIVNRPTCSSSGADGGDLLKVDILGGIKPNMVGAGNSLLNDSYMLIGPGTIRLSATVNRIDEIITYNVSTSGTCPTCNVILPVGLIFFEAENENGIPLIQWETAREINNDFFRIERSEDGINFYAIKEVKGAGNSEQNTKYSLRDKDAKKGINYYKLTQTDFDGTEKEEGIISVVVGNDQEFSVFPNPSEDFIFISGRKTGEQLQITCVNQFGQLIPVNFIDAQNGLMKYDISTLENGSYFIRITSNTNTEILRFNKQ